MIERFRKFVLASGVSGDEKGVSEVIKKELEAKADEIKTDALGNLIVLRRGKSSKKKLMFAAHMDEIGFMVNFIDDKGYLRISRIGGISFAASAYSKVVFDSGRHKSSPLLGVLVPEAKTAANDFRQDTCYIDIGAKSKEDAEKYVSVGDFCRVVPSLEEMTNGRLCGRPIDNRVGCYIIAETALRSKKPKYDTYFVFTSQEEVGVRGAKVSAFSVAPDYAIAIDIGGSGDIVNCNPMVSVLGGGAAIKIKDAMVICSPQMVDSMKNAAEKIGAKYQFEILESGGTDTCMLQQAGGGCIAGAFSVPTRYGHSGVETVDINDIEDIIRISVELTESGAFEG